MRKVNNDPKTNETRTDYPRLNTPFRILSAHWAGDNSYCFFSLRLVNLGIDLYNMKLLYDKNGNPQIYPASVKGKDGKYYNQYAVYMSDEMQAGLVEQLEEK